ncbi:MAG: EFR1 family ferrodoxin [Suipraeoptans sp.]
MKSKKAKRNITLVYFSPGGATKNISEIFASAISEDIKRIDLLKTPLIKTTQLSSDDLFIVVLPVFAGRIPSICPDMLRKFIGDNTPAIIISVYGNRNFDDTLLEMNDILKENSFNIIGAAAFIARHSIFTEVAAKRPDYKDRTNIKIFAKSCMNKLDNFSDYEPLKIPGHHPYCKPTKMPIRPIGKKKTCTKCGICAKLCPTNAIDSDNPIKTDKSKCISCMACVYHCPSHSRALYSPLYKIAKRPFKKKCKVHRKPVILV